MTSTTRKDKTKVRILKWPHQPIKKVLGSIHTSPFPAEYIPLKKTLAVAFYGTILYCAITHIKL